MDFFKFIEFLTEHGNTDQKSLLTSTNKTDFDYFDLDTCSFQELYEKDVENTINFGNINRPATYSKYLLHKFVKCVKYGFVNQFYLKSKDSDLQPLLKLKSFQDEYTRIKENTRRSMVNSKLLNEVENTPNLGVYETRESFQGRICFDNLSFGS